MSAASPMGEVSVVVSPGEDGAITLLSNELIEDEGNILPEYESAFDCYISF